MRGNGDENMVESHQLQESIVQYQDIVSPNVVSVAGTTITEEVFGRVDLESGPSDQAVAMRWMFWWLKAMSLLAETITLLLQILRRAWELHLKRAMIQMRVHFLILWM